MSVRKLVAIIGPTASGKTSLAVDLARRIGAEVIGADSRQVYRGMDIGTAKPSAAEQTAARHHLIDVVDPDEPFSLGEWLELTNGALEDIWSRGKQPLLVGGTGQYAWALLEGWRVPSVPAQNGLRAEMEARGAESLIAELRHVDPEAEAYIDPRNVRRIVRALEVYHATGKPLTHWRTKDPPHFDSLNIGLSVPRAELHQRIDERVERMVERGFVAEVESLLKRGYSADLPSMSAVGYREICAHLAGEMTLAMAVERTKAGTHRLARHQHAWFKPSDERIQWLDTDASGFEQAKALVVDFVSAGRPLK